MWYFAYGSNMDRKRLELHRAIRVKEIRKGELENYQLVFNKVSSIQSATGCANIIPEVGHRVQGILYKIRDDDISKMDIFEGVSSGQYHRERIFVKAEDNDLIEAEVYVADETEDELLPSEEYLEHLLETAREVGLDGEYISETLQVRCSAETEG
jgi:cation transport regulator ChaC